MVPGPPNSMCCVDWCRWEREIQPPTTSTTEFGHHVVRAPGTCRGVVRTNDALWADEDGCRLLPMARSLRVVASGCPVASGGWTVPCVGAPGGRRRGEVFLSPQAGNVLAACALHAMTTQLDVAQLLVWVGCGGSCWARVVLYLASAGGVWPGTRRGVWRAMQAELRLADAWDVLPVCPLGRGHGRIACRAMATELCALGARGGKEWW